VNEVGLCGGEGAKRHAFARRLGPTRTALLQLVTASSLHLSFFSIFGFQSLDEFICLLLRHIFGDSVALLNSSYELLPSSVDGVHIIIGELSPTFLSPAPCTASICLPLDPSSLPTSLDIFDLWLIHSRFHRVCLLQHDLAIEATIGETKQILWTIDSHE
jgi:hypothetical protein